MKSLFLIDIADLDHRRVKSSGSGASEFQFYMLAEKLSETYNVVVFNRRDPADGESVSAAGLLVDRVRYCPLESLAEFAAREPEATLLVLRRMTFMPWLSKRLTGHRVLFWLEDHIHADSSLFGDTPDEKRRVLKLMAENVELVFVSDWQRQEALAGMGQFADVSDIKSHIVPNAIYPETMPRRENVQTDPNKLVYVSAWQKGLARILPLLDALHAEFPEIRVHLTRPNYERQRRSVDDMVAQREYCVVRDTIKRRDDFCDFVSDALCMLGTSFGETFGCAFLESHYLGVPVIGFSYPDSAIRNLVPADLMCPLAREPEPAHQQRFVELVAGLRQHRSAPTFDSEFLADSVLKRWRSLLG